MIADLVPLLVVPAAMTALAVMVLVAFRRFAAPARAAALAVGRVRGERRGRAPDDAGHLCGRRALPPGR